MQRMRRNTVITGVLAGLVAVLAVATGVMLAGAIAGSGKTIVTVRLWDDKVAAAYKSSFAAFQESNPDITVDVTVIPWSQYWTQLDADAASGRLDDIFWVNNSYYADLADDGNLLDIGEALGQSAKNDWDRAVVTEFTRDGKLWGVPQLSDAGIAMFYNKRMLTDAAIDPAQLEYIQWSLDPASDSMLPLLKTLAIDTTGNNATSTDFNKNAIKQFAYNAANDLQAIVLPTIGSNGATFDVDGHFTFASPASAEAVGYQVDLINKHHVAPPAAITNVDADYNRELFVNGKLALFQTGLYNLPYVFEGSEFEWGIAPMPTGPEGRVSVTNGIVAAGNAHTANLEATTRVLKWLGSEEGNRFVGSTGAAVPAVVAAQQAYFDYWGAKDVDVSKFFEVLANDAPTVTPPQSSNFAQVEAAYAPILNEVFTGKKPVASGLQEAQDAANAVAAEK